MKRIVRLLAIVVFLTASFLTNVSSVSANGFGPSATVEVEPLKVGSAYRLEAKFYLFPWNVQQEAYVTLTYPDGRKFNSEKITILPWANSFRFSPSATTEVFGKAEVELRILVEGADFRFATTSYVFYAGKEATPTLNYESEIRFDLEPQEEARIYALTQSLMRYVEPVSTPSLKIKSSTSRDTKAAPSNRRFKSTSLKPESHSTFLNYNDTWYHLKGLYTLRTNPDKEKFVSVNSLVSISVGSAESNKQYALGIVNDLTRWDYQFVVTGTFINNNILNVSLPGATSGSVGLLARDIVTTLTGEKTLVGNVYSSRDFISIGNALVEIYSASTDCQSWPSQTATTLRSDAKGNWQKKLSAGWYMVRVTYNDYRDYDCVRATNETTYVNSAIDVHIYPYIDLEYHPQSAVISKDLTVTLKVKTPITVSKIYAAEVGISFDPEVLEVASVTFNENTTLVLANSWTNDGAIFLRFAGKGVEITGNFDMPKVRFKVKDPESLTWNTLLMVTYSSVSTPEIAFPKESARRYEAYDYGVWVPVITYTPGDFNSDGIVDILDFSTLASEFGKTCTQERPCLSDIVGNGGRPDGVVTILDFSVLASNFGRGQRRGLG